ncbi:MAG TPA: TRAP transporter large permease subunit, partial [Polyangiaceae bacterium]|nr:TRAP transporter large permease subunit [Polyangiaceae bacterium]
SAIAVAYAALLSIFVYREVRFRDLPGILRRSAITTAVVMLLVGCSQAMSWVLAYQNIPQTVGAGFLALSDDPRALLLVVNVLLLLAGTFLDMTPAVLIFTPILLPVLSAQGVDPVHFGMIMITNLCIGLCTPPVGTCLFVGCSVGRTSLARVLPPLVPMFVAMLAALLLITFVPGLSLWLPALFGL